MRPLVVDLFTRKCRSFLMPPWYHRFQLSTNASAGVLQLFDKTKLIAATYVVTKHFARRR